MAREASLDAVTGIIVINFDSNVRFYSILQWHALRGWFSFRFFPYSEPFSSKWLGTERVNVLWLEHLFIWMNVQKACILFQIKLTLFRNMHFDIWSELNFNSISIQCLISWMSTFWWCICLLALSSFWHFYNVPPASQCVCVCVKNNWLRLSKDARCKFAYFKSVQHQQ